MTSTPLSVTEYSQLRNPHFHFLPFCRKYFKTLSFKITYTHLNKGPAHNINSPFIMAAPLRIGFVPEHFSTPLHFAQKYFGLDATLIPFPSGTGHMITALRADEIDIGIGLTEAWIAGLGKEGVEGDGGYRLVGTYVETPLCEYISHQHDMVSTQIRH